MNLVKFIKNNINLVGFVFLFCFTHAVCADPYPLPATCKQMGGSNDCVNLLRQASQFVGQSGLFQAVGQTAEELNQKLLEQWIASPGPSSYSYVLRYSAFGYPCPSLIFGIANGYAMIDGNCSVVRYNNGVEWNVLSIYNAYANISCPVGWTPKGGNNNYLYRFNTGDKINGTCEKQSNPSVKPIKQPQSSSCSANSASKFTDNPISIGTGVKALWEKDYASNEFSVRRTYSSAGLVSGVNVGYGWQFSLESKILQDTPTWITVARADGRYLYFKLISSVWTPDADIADRLTALVGGGWSYQDAATENTEYFNSNGALTSVASKSGRITTYTRNTAGNVIAISNELGQQLTIKYRTDIPTVDYLQFPDASRITYGYTTITTPTTTTNLTSVSYPDGKVKTYHYGESAYVSATPLAGVSNANLLTGITDENGIRYATYSYDNKGRAFSEFLAGNVEQNALVYNVDGSGNPTSTVVTDPRGSSRTYNFTTILGVVKSTGQSQPAGSGCAASAAALTYDVNGNVASRTDFKGNKTTYVYDMARNLETSRTEGLTAANALTPATRTITTTYHPTWRLPLVITEYNGGTTNLSNGSGTPTGTALRSTTNVYDTKGNITSITEADPVRSTSRSTTMTYTYSTAVPGLVLTKVVDGPRTEVSDITTYNYYPHDATCTPSTATPLIDPITGLSPPNLGCRGQLQSMSNALNQTTSYDRYNHHGQVEQMTDANGLVTTSTYDLRQRLLTRTTGTEITTLTYDNVGQVTQLSLPDASQLNYTYDAAHRLTDVQDNLGNKVHYTLDTEGNRTNETTTDPNNQLTKTLSRSYDALNRLQQVTGLE